MEYGLIKTKIGWCGALCSDRGVRRIVIGARSRGKARSLVLVGLSPKGAVPVLSEKEQVRDALEKLRRYLSGKRVDFRAIRLDMTSCTGFERAVYHAARKIPYGETVRYKDVADRIGHPRAYRAVGRALGKNPFPLVVPCHRVIGSDGGLCGFSGLGGLSLKRRLLSMEKGMRGKGAL